jgi:glycosyltransferase involved in cell wall biosynthesis
MAVTTDISIVMPAHNEEAYLAEAVEKVTDELRRRSRRFEVIICENGSTDATAAVAAGLAERYCEVRILRLPLADYGNALRAGFEAASGVIVVNFDVDYVDVAFMDRALTVADDEKATIVVGSKRSAGAQDQRALGRRVVTSVFSLVLRHGFGLGVSDTHGVKLLRREPLTVLVQACRFGSDIFDTELILRAERAGLAVREIPVTVTEHRPPRTSIARRIPRSLLGLARLRVLLWREAIGRPAVRA